MDQVSPSETKSIQVSPCESKWIQVRYPNEFKWAQMDPTWAHLISFGLDRINMHWLQLNSLGLSWLHLDWLSLHLLHSLDWFGFTWIHLSSLEFIWIVYNHRNACKKCWNTVEIYIYIYIYIYWIIGGSAPLTFIKYKAIQWHLVIYILYIPVYIYIYIYTYIHI